MRPTRRVGGPRHPLPIWPCFQRGLPSRLVTQTRRALLPHDFTLTSASRGGLFLWHFPSGRPAPRCRGRCALLKSGLSSPILERIKAVTRPTPVALWLVNFDDSVHDGIKVAREQGSGIALRLPNQHLEPRAPAVSHAPRAFGSVAC